MATSRIFVRGLPPSLTEDDFRSHFSKGREVTDLQLKPLRRIGYVGFKTPEAAASAVKYFHKSFIRMSRLHVELAEQFSQAQRTSRTPTSRVSSQPKAAEHPSGSPSNSLKRKLAQPASTKDDGVGADDDSPLLQYGNKIVAGPEHQDSSSGTRNDSLPQASGSGLEIMREGTSRDKDQVQEDEGGKVTNAKARASSANFERAAADDGDWMRSRTTRLLGLADDEDDSRVGDVGVEEPSASVQSEFLSDATPTQITSGSSLAHGTNGIEDPEQKLDNAEEGIVHSSGRIFLRNLAYHVTKDDLCALLETFGGLKEVHVPLESASGGSKGFAFAQYEHPESAQQALQRLDGTISQGRLLHIIPASAKRDTKLDEFAIAQLPLKKRKLIEKRTNPMSTAFNWNSMFMNADAVVTSAAARLGVQKSDLLDPTSSDAAVKQAQIETHTIQEAKKYFESNGVNLASFTRGNREGQCLLVKNFKYNTTAEDLKTLFSESADVKRVLMPPSGTIAIVEFPNKVQAKTSFSKFAYRKYKDSVLFLERAPSDIFISPGSEPKQSVANADQVPADDFQNAAAELAQEEADDQIETSTLFVRNLSFATTSERLREMFKPLEGLLSARVKTRADPKREGNTLSMGFGFLEFQTNDQARAAFLAMNGYMLDGHELQIKASHKGLDAAAERRLEDKTKRQKQRKSRIIIKNLPFEASKKDVRNLFGSYGQVKAVRLPKTSGNSSRGYAFADFTNALQAEKAMELGKTHLLGRKLVLEYAAGEPEDPEKEIEKMQEKIGRQSNSIALQRLTASDRKRFNAGDAEEASEV